MATSANRSVTESIRNEFLSCHICFEVFTDPRILPCLHTYCFQCICTLVETNQTEGRAALCPLCREPIPETVDSLKTNFFINGLTELVKVKSDEFLKCTACSLRGIESIAKVKCLDCGDYLCSTCSDGHNASSLTWKHEKIPLDDIKQGTYDEKLRQLQKIKCLQHADKDVEYYCDSCCQPVCLTCVLINHRDHKCQTVSDAIAQRKANIISLTGKIRNNLTHLEKRESSVLSKLDTTKKEREREVSIIEEKAELEISQIIAKKEAAIETLTARSMRTEKEQSSELEEVRLQKGVVSSCLVFCDNILEKGRDEEILMLEKMITERLGHLQEQSRERRSGETCCTTVTDVVEEPLEKFNASSDENIHEVKTEEESIANEPDLLTEMLEKFKVSHAGAVGTAVVDAQMLDLKRLQIFMCQHESDTKTPDIKGFAFGSEIGLVLSDKANKNIKVYSTAGRLKRVFTMDNFTPFAVAIAGQVIGVVSENYLHLLKETGQVVNKILIHSKKPNSSYQFTYALTASKDEFIVGNIPDESRLRVYNVDGTVKDLISYRIQFPIKSLSFTHTGSIVICEWGTGSVKVISREGNAKTKCKRTPQWKPNDACVTSDGTVFVADYDFGDICAFDKSGKLFLEHSTTSDGIKPVGVVIDEQERLFVVGKYGHVSCYDIVRKL